MLKFKAEKIETSRNWNLQTAIGMVAKWNGTLLYTSPNYTEQNKIILAINPIASISSEQGDNIELIDKTIKDNSQLTFPFLFGYLNYDAKHLMESTGLYANLRDTSFPDFLWTAYEYVFFFDTQWNAKVQNQLSNGKNIHISISEIEQFAPCINEPFHVSSLKSQLNKTEFINGVLKVQEYIKAGDAYQVNLTRKLSGTITGSKTQAAKVLLQSNRIEFGVFYQHEHRQIISTSPERLFKTDGKQILTSPIKGTVEKTNSNSTAGEKLLTDTKNLRELSMIIDLLRNDLSRICIPGTVKVNGFPILKTLNNVFHLVADIEGMLNKVSMSEIFKALFPGGSITGCPKIRACQIIEELEQKGRGPYTGSFGYVTGNNRADMNILIRTVLIEYNKISFNVGGGITLLSDADDEFAETQHKAANILKALNVKE